VNKYQNFLIFILSGLIIGFAFPPNNIFLLAFIGFVPILYIFYINEEHKIKFRYIYLTFFLYHSISNWWIGSWQKDTDPYLTASAIALAIIHPFFFFIPFYFLNKFAKILNKKYALLLFPFIWVGFEWFHSLGEASYPWLTIGNTQINNYYWIQFIDITGIWGASLLILYVNIFLVFIFSHIKVEFEFKEFINNNRYYIISILLIIFIPFIYSFFSIKYWENDKSYDGELEIGIIQPSINPWRKWDTSVDKQIDLHFKLQDSLYKSNPKISLFIWSETSIPVHINYEDKYQLNRFQKWADEHNCSMLAGFAEIQFYNKDNATPTARIFNNDSNLFYESYNSAFIANPYEINNGRYRKMKLTPFAERIPYVEYILFMRKWFEWGVGISSWGLGNKQNILTLSNNNKNIKFAPIICIESIYPKFVSNFSKLEAEFFVIITNDSWYDYTPGPRQHYIIAQARAIENRKYIARCANSGISGVISATGHSIKEIPQYKVIGESFNIKLSNHKTIYSIFGDWLPILSAISLFAIFLLKYIKK